MSNAALAKHRGPRKPKADPELIKRRQRIQRAAREFRMVHRVPKRIPASFIEDAIVWSDLVPAHQAGNVEMYIRGCTNMIQQALGIAAFAQWTK